MKRRLPVLLMALILVSLPFLPAFADEEKPTATPTAEVDTTNQNASRSPNKPTWEKSLDCWEQEELPSLTLTGKLREDVLIIARSQLGYSSDRNCFRKDKAGNKRYYTRYGEWEGAIYGDWCDTFVSFCVHYAGKTDYPKESSCARHMFQLKADGYWREWNSYIPKPGDLVFFAIGKGSVAPNHVGIVEKVMRGEGNEAGKLVTIEGNMRNPEGGTSCVVRTTRTLQEVVGYGTFEIGKPYPKEYTVRSSGWEIIGDDSIYFIEYPKEEVLRFLGLYDTRYYRYWYPQESAEAETEEEQLAASDNGLKPPETDAQTTPKPPETPAEIAAQAEQPGGRK